MADHQVPAASAASNERGAPNGHDDGVAAHPAGTHDDVRTEDSDGEPEDDGGSGSDRQSPRRRRGSRGGRNRKRPSPGDPADGGDPSMLAATGGPERSGDGADEYERRPSDLPDHPREGVPSAEASEAVAVRPRIGDTRPAPNLPAAARGSTSDRSASDRSASDRSDAAQAQRPRRRGGNGDRPDSLGTDSPTGDSRITDSRITDSQVGGTPAEGRTAKSEPTPAGRVDLQPHGEPSEAPPTKEPRSSPSGRRRRGRGGDPDAAGAAGAPGTRRVEPVLLDKQTLEKRRGKERNGRPLGRYLMCVHAHPKATQIAVLEGRSLIEHYVSRPSDSVSQIHGNIYFGRVQNVLPGMEAAFVDIGTPKNAVLYRGDVQFDAGDIDGAGGNVGGRNSGGRSKKVSDARIEEMLRNGQMLVSQVTKNPIGSKGARLTQEVSLPGRFVVLVPNSDTYGISKRLGDDERKRLRRILDDVRPTGHGLIVRTAAEGATAEELRRDVELLTRQWAAIEAKAAKSKGPVLLHKEPDMAVRAIREEFNRNYRGVIIDDRALYEEVRDYVESITPELADRVEFYDPAVEGLPLFEKQHVHEQLHKAIDRKVWLPSGGSLIIERTEALTVIDVNTGKNVGSSSLEETVFRNNLEAADEIARQLRLRDIGGIIVIDFIDMEIRVNRATVVDKFRDALARDKTRTQVFEITELGLVEMTRKRISEGLVESLSQTCPTCGGRGFTFDEDLISE